MHRLGAWNVISPLNVDVISVWLLSRELFHLSRAAKSKKLILDIAPLSSQPFNFRTHLLLILLRRFIHGGPGAILSQTDSRLRYQVLPETKPAGQATAIFSLI